VSSLAIRASDNGSESRADVGLVIADPYDSASIYIFGMILEAVVRGIAASNFGVAFVCSLA
jgi:hypothetical protein